MARAGARRSEDLPPDNSARIALFDAMAYVAESNQFNGIDADRLFELVVPRMRVLVPRELHVQGEQSYVEAKIAACVDAGILQAHPRLPGLLLLGPRTPSIRYPDGTVHNYTAGLEAARERLDADEDKLRRGGFDVRQVVSSPANDKKSERYRNLVASMREHGFLEWSEKGRSHACFPIIESSSGVIDGVARVAAAAEAGVSLKKQHRVRLPARRDTPLHHALLVLHLNADRLDEEEHVKVHDAISARTGRAWLEIQMDLDITRDWRRAEPKEYDAKLEVRLLPYSPEREPKVQVTIDGGRVMLRSIMREAGVPEYRRDDLLPHVAWEEARTQFSGKKAIFVKVPDAVRGIERMQQDRERRRLKTDPAWEDIRVWLESFEHPTSSDVVIADSSS